MRNILSVLAGFAAWTVLWLASNAALVAAVPAAFREDGSTESVGVLILVLVLSVVFSVGAGYLTATLAEGSSMKYPAVLGVVLLAVGLFVQLQSWDVMPVWYHVFFLALLVPGVLLGAHTQRDGQARPGRVSVEKT